MDLRWDRPLVPAGRANGCDMNETDDRLAGDPVWELFAAPTTGAAERPADFIATDDGWSWPV